METKSKMADGCCSSHVGCAAVLAIERNLPPVTPMSHQKIGPVGQKMNGNQIQDCGHLG
jgi:hypothetical protein